MSKADKDRPPGHQFLLIENGDREWVAICNYCGGTTRQLPGAAGCEAAREWAAAHSCCEKHDDEELYIGIGHSFAGATSYRSATELRCRTCGRREYKDD